MFRRDLADTARLAAPIALAQLAQMGMATTDTLMLGSVGPASLAAGGLGATLFFVGLFISQGLLAAAGVLIARARGAGRVRSVAPIYWNAAWLALGLACLLFALASRPGPFLRLIGEPAEVVSGVSAYLGALRWGAFGGLAGIGLMRVVLPALGLQWFLLWAALACLPVNALLNWALIWGHGGLPALGMAGSGAATAATLSLSAVVLLTLLHGVGRWRHLLNTVAFRSATMAEVVALGAPIAGSVAVEAGLFLGTSLLAGRLGAEVLAGHQVAVNVASITFMVPFAIGQAANVRVAMAAGAEDAPGVRRAAEAAVALGAGFMAAAAIGLFLGRAAIAHAYLGNSAAAAVASRLLVVAAAFQVVDGVQAVVSGALRGLKDTRVPFLVGAVGYWVVGFGAGATLAFGAGLGALGLWWGLFAGLGFTAAALSLRLLRQVRRLD